MVLFNEQKIAEQQNSEAIGRGEEAQKAESKVISQQSQTINGLEII